VNSIALHTDFTLRRGCYSEDNHEKKVSLNTIEDMGKAAKSLWEKMVAE